MTPLTFRRRHQAGDSSADSPPETSPAESPGESRPETSTAQSPGDTLAETSTAESPGEPPPETSAAGGSGQSSAQASTGRRRVSLSALLLALLVIAAACAGWFGWSWHSAASVGPPAYSQTRDRALAAGEQAIQNFNTLDYRHVDQGLRLWLQSSAGALHSQVLRGRAQFEQQVRLTKTITTARVLDGALTQLSVRAGTAKIIVALQITVVPAQGPVNTKPSRLQGTLARTPAGWRLTGIGQVPVGGTTVGGTTGGG